MSLLPLFTAGYSIARKTRLLELAWFRGLFASCYFFYKRFHEDSLSGLLHSHPDLIGNGDILDIGANIGYASCILAATLKPGSKIYAFEPDQFNFHLLQEVILKKGLSEKIVPIKTAVGTSDGLVDFWQNQSNPADHRVVTSHYRHRPSCSDSQRISTIPVTSIDSFVMSHQMQELSFIKIDVQGYELAVCEGMGNTLAAFPEATLCFEYAPSVLVEMGVDPGNVLDFFRSRGYLLHVVARSTLRLAEDNEAIRRLADAERYIDVICSRRQLA